MSLSTIGSIATFLSQSFDNLPLGISGNLLFIADMARQHVENYVGITIGSNSIESKYQPAILDFAKADVVDMMTAEGANSDVSLSELKVGGGANITMSSQAFRKMGEEKLKLLGRKISFARSVS